MNTVAEPLNPASVPLNPLVNFSGLPRFDELKPEHVAPAIDDLLAEGRATIERVMAAPVTWDSFVAPLEDANERIGAGATLVQLYTGLIYRGPQLVAEIARALARR